MEGLSHTSFIAASYIICFTVLAGMALITMVRARAAKRQAAELEAVSPRRRRADTQ